jgi:hypothetical protein
MKKAKTCTAKWAVSALAAAAIFAGCSTGTQSSLSPSGTAQNGSHRVGPLATVSNVVQIDNAWTQTIFGSGSATCWSISPTPLPSVAPSASSPPVTLTYNTTCPVTAPLPIRYGPGVTPLEDCTFNVGYNGTNFTYSVTQGTHTDCTAKPSPISSIDEILTYDQVTPSLRHPMTLHKFSR